MNKKIIISLLFISMLFSQASLSDINKMANKELDKLRNEIKNSSELIKDKKINDSDQESNIVVLDYKATEVLTSKYFGFDYFNKEVTFFDNIPTPVDYRLGAGDEVTISLWGETNLRETLTINKDGMVYYENIGFINLSNKTLESAELLLVQEFSKIYSTLKDVANPTTLMLELGKLKSINIYFSGNINNPGINLVHPFSDIFSAIVQAGGVSDKGSLRDIQLIRNGQIITTVDFYSFFINGKNTFSNIKIIDGDTIHIPSFKNRIAISGEVNRPSIYELTSNESLSHIITYASGLTSQASSTLILNQIIPVEERLSDDNARTSVAINFKNKESITLNNGDTILVPSIPTVDSNVTIYGRVKSPGVYPGINTSLKNTLDIAGGFDDPIFRQTIREDEIVVLRQDSNQFNSKEIKVSYQDADQLKLEPNDKIFVYEDINYKNNFTYRVEGEVFKPGTYPFSKDKITVGDALSLAGGLTELSSVRNLTVKQEFTELDDEGNKINTSEPVNNVTLDFELGINSVIVASPLENVVRVEGNVYNPGLITFSKGYRYPRYIELAGGYKSDTLKNKTYIKRANGNIEKVNGFFISRGKKVYPGDTIIVPADPNPSDFDITAFISDLSTTLANIAAILLIADNQTN
ncbi:SLBB domain-containing protein [Candidatus Marinimicrobia bacterium]|nr:SLBB domain-containing protein [Candidatus Neomarinimicrobiota bacterium]